MNYTVYNDELYHHGVKGQKWGVRRYQNADGSLTAKGEKRYNTGKFTFRDLKTVRKYIKNNGKNGTEYKKALSYAKKKLSNTSRIKDVNAWNKAFFEGTQKLQEGMLLDAGYSKEKAKRGSEWLSKNGYNITWTDSFPLHDYYDD